MTNSTVLAQPRVYLSQLSLDMCWTKDTCNVAASAARPSVRATPKGPRIVLLYSTPGALGLTYST